MSNSLATQHLRAVYISAIVCYKGDMCIDHCLVSNQAYCQTLRIYFFMILKKGYGFQISHVNCSWMMMISTIYEFSNITLITFSRLSQLGDHLPNLLCTLTSLFCSLFKFWVIQIQMQNQFYGGGERKQILFFICMIFFVILLYLCLCVTYRSFVAIQWCFLSIFMFFATSQSFK